MAIWINRAMPLLGVATLLVCCVLAARTVNLYIDAQYFGESAQPQWTPPDQVRTTREPAPKSRDKSGAALAARNMFCATCTPPTEIDGPIAPVATDGVPLSGLPLELLATNLTRPERASFATVRHRESGQQGSFFPGDRLPGTGAIARIEGTAVIFHNPTSNRLEQLSLLSARPASAVREPRKRGDARKSKPLASNRYSERVKKIDDTTYEVDRTLVDQLIGNPAQLGARVRPVAKKDGGVSFKLYGIRSTSPLSAIGIRNGDAIEAINSHVLTSDPDKLLEMYTKLRDQQRLSVSVRRRGQLIAMDYRVH